MRETLLRDCVARSRPLTSALDSTEDVALPSDWDPEDLLADWRAAFDSGEEFRERLELADLDAEAARERLADATERSPDSLPSAFEIAERVVDRAVEADRPVSDSVAARRDESPFADLVGPLAEAVSDGTEFGSDLAPSALESLEDWLFERLTNVFQHPLFIAFKTYQRTEYPERNFEDATDSTAVYEEFVETHRDYEPIFEQYPVLLKLLGVVADQWRGTVRRLTERVATDRSSLARAFNDGDPLGPVADVDALSDDPHGDGEVVWGVHFESDCSVVYKPRPVGGEAAFEALLDWTNARTDVPDLYAPTVLDREEYGWMEFVTHDECDSVAGVERYYERMGVLSGLAVVLGSTDLHRENVVAAGDQPVIVDHETILSPRFETSTSPSAPAMSSLLEGSILETLLVPFASGLDDGETTTNSGLAKLDGVEYEKKSPAFVRPNTDAMDLTFQHTHAIDGTNLPRLDGEIREASNYVEELKRGFRDVVDAVGVEREDFLGPDGPLRAFEGCEVRYVLRPTKRYSSKLVESVYSSRLRSGLQRSLALESLYGIFLPESDDERWKLVETEKATLGRFTVPRFTVEATGRELRDGRGEPQGVFVDQSPLDHARERVADLDDHWVETQLRLLDLAFTDSAVPDPVSAPSAERTGGISDADAPAKVVSNVVALLEETTTEYPDGSDRWVELARSSPTDAILLQEPELNLYEGYAGVGLFLAAAAAVRDDDELAARSRRVLKPIRSAFEDGEADHLGIGGTTGKGSIAYGLVTAGDLLGDDELVERGRAVAERTTHEEIAADADLDVMAGAAGELLAQLSVHERTGDGKPLERARRCGDRLLDATTETPTGHRIPTSEDAPRRFGFAHGVGGIGTALVKLSSVTGDDEYARVGRDAIRFDTELWRRERGPTGDDEGHAESETIWGWCNGVAGVGLSRVAVAETASSESLPSVLREDLQTDLSLEDSVCCGSAGRALFALDAGETLEDPALVSRGEELFTATLERAQREGRLRLGNHLPMLPRFGLFTGLAGVGYVALQFEAREKGLDLPNVTRLA